MAVYIPAHTVSNKKDVTLNAYMDVFRTLVLKDWDALLMLEYAVDVIEW